VKRLCFRWGWPPLRWEPSQAKQLADQSEADYVRVHTDVIVPLRRIRENDHLMDAIAEDMRRRHPEGGGA
jgi:hypothetical protein